MNNIDKDIQEAERKLAELKRQKQEFDAMSPETKLADKLHSIKCRANHTDGCGWFYESWEKPGWSRDEYLKQARKVLKQEPNVDLVMRILDICQ